ncbi:CapA family protein, partial [Modestobacter roseus]|nr:CapA family protein [Modestobacter roseus]
MLVALAVLLVGCGADEPAPAAAPSSSPSSAAPAAPSTTAPAPDSFSLVATGDVLVHQGRALTRGAQQPDGSWDFAPVFAPIAPVIEQADLAICHLETPVAPVGG